MVIGFIKSTRCGTLVLDFRYIAGDISNEHYKAVKTIV